MGSDKNRNKEIYEAYLKGVKKCELAVKYEVSNSRIRQIIEKEKRKEEKGKEDVYIIMKSLCKDESLLARTITVLERNGIFTEEDFLTLDRKSLLKLRNCGTQMTDFIMEVQDVIKKK